MASMWVVVNKHGDLYEGVNSNTRYHAITFRLRLMYRVDAATRELGREKAWAKCRAKGDRTAKVHFARQVQPSRSDQRTA